MSKRGTHLGSLFLSLSKGEGAAETVLTAPSTLPLVRGRVRRAA